MTQNDDLLTVRGLRKRFPGAPAPVFEDLDLAVRRARMVGLLGANGCGKTTLLQCLVGILPLDAGEVRVVGVPMNLRDGRAKRALGYVPDDHPIRLKLSVGEYLALCAALHAIAPREARSRIADLVEQLNLGEFRSVHLESCSHGITKRVAFAAAILHRPAVLVLDEPESGLDAFAFASLTRELRAHRDAGGSVLVTTHRADWAERHCDSVMRMEDGRLQTMSSEQVAALAV